MCLGKVIAEYGYLTDINFKVDHEIFGNESKGDEYFKYFDNLEFKLPEEQKNRLNLASGEDNFVGGVFCDMFGYLAVKMCYRIEGRKEISEEDFWCFTLNQTLGRHVDGLVSTNTILLGMYKEGITPPAELERKTFKEGFDPQLSTIPISAAITKKGCQEKNVVTTLVDAMYVNYPIYEKIVRKFLEENGSIGAHIWVEKKRVLETEEGRAIWV